MEAWFDPKVALQQGATVCVLLMVMWYYRLDVRASREEDRQDRIKERADLMQSFGETVTELKDSMHEMLDTHKSTVETIVQKCETTERMSEARFQALLQFMFAQKGDPANP